MSADITCDHFRRFREDVGRVRELEVSLWRERRSWEGSSDSDGRTAP